MTKTRTLIATKHGGVRTMYLVFGALVLSFALIIAFHNGPSRQTVLDLMNIVVPFVAAGACLFTASRMRSRRLKVFWFVVATGLVLSAMAEGVWALYELVLGRDSPYPSIADGLWLLFYPLEFGALVGLLSFKGRERLTASAAVLDAVLFALAGAAATWLFVTLPSLDTGATWLENAVTIAYPTGDVLLLAGLASLALIPKRDRLPGGMPWLAAAFAINIVADLHYSVLAVSDNYVTGNWIDALWPLTYALMGVGALRQLVIAGAEPVVEPQRISVTGVARRARKGGITHAIMPYVSLPIAGVIFVSAIAGGNGSSLVYRVSSAGAAFLIIVLVVARQLIMLIENRRLRASLEAEKEQLSLLNELGVEMSHCGSSRQVVEAGLRILQAAAKCDATAAWIRPAAGRERLYGSRGVTRAQRLQMRAALRGEMRPLDQAIAGEARLVPSDPGSASFPDEAAGSSSVAVIPLISRHACIGALAALVDAETAPSLGTRLGLASAVASQVAVAFENARRFEEARYLASRDPVTNLLNHRGINERIEQELARCQRVASCFSLVMMDLDDFKLFNDTYGHAVGDDVLKATSRILRRSARKSDVFARYGGDEFLALLPDTNSAEALALFERVQAAVKAYAFRPDGTTAVPIKVSYGVATYPGDGRHVSEVLSAADASLYHSKAAGGNRITVSATEGARGSDRGGAFGVLDGLVTTVNNKDQYTRKHSEEVCQYSVRLAAKIGLSEDTQRVVRIAALLHDIGKIGVPDHILRKPGGLSPEEYDAAKQHVRLGELIIKEIPNLGEVVRAISTHHERFDGGGYPEGLSGESIPLLGRILAVTDAYSAMTNDRPYRKALTIAEAREELLSVAGSQLDPSLVDAFLVMHGDERASAAVSGSLD